MGAGEDKLKRMYAELKDLADEAELSVIKIENGIEIISGSSSRVFDGINESIAYVIGFIDGACK